MSRGKHVRTKRAARDATVVSGLAALGLATAPMYAIPAQAAPDEAWDPLIDCESGGNPTAQNPNSTASGLYQIIDGTWEYYGGREFAPTAAQATPEQQRIVAERIAFLGWNGRAPQGPQAWVEPCNDSLEAWVAAGMPVLTESVPIPNPADPSTDPRVGAELVVEPGDTLAELGELFGIPWRDIAAANGILEPWTIHVGQVLTIPGVTQQQIVDLHSHPDANYPPPVPPAAPIHVVQPGEWLSTIAQDYGVCEHGEDITTCWIGLHEANRDVIGPDPDRIFPGQELVIAEGMVVPAPQPVPEEDVVVPMPAPPPPPPATTSPDGTVVRPVQGRVGDGLNEGRPHAGVDIDCNIGDPVVAALGGYVQTVRDFDGGSPYTGYGKVVDVIGTDGALYRYAHLDTTTVAQGSVVLAGYQIGTCGNTGAVVAGQGGNGSHLHFERRPSGELYGPPDDAEAWLARNGVL